MTKRKDRTTALWARLTPTLTNCRYRPSAHVLQVSLMVTVTAGRPRSSSRQLAESRVRIVRRGSPPVSGRMLLVSRSESTVGAGCATPRGFSVAPFGHGPRYAAGNDENDDRPEGAGDSSPESETFHPGIRRQNDRARTRSLPTAITPESYRSARRDSDRSARPTPAPALVNRRAPAPSKASTSSGLASWQLASDRQPQPIQPLNRSRSPSRCAMRSSSSSLHRADSRAQSCRVGVLFLPSSSSADRTSRSGIPTRWAVRMKATLRSVSRAVTALIAGGALGGDQPFGLVEAQCRRRKSAARRQLPDCQLLSIKARGGWHLT